jgi:hypothetical protein
MAKNCGHLNFTNSTTEPTNDVTVVVHFTYTAMFGQKVDGWSVAVTDDESIGVGRHGVTCIGLHVVGQFNALQLGAIVAILIQRITVKRSYQHTTEVERHLRRSQR